MFNSKNLFQLAKKFPNQRSSFTTSPDDQNKYE